MSVVDDGRRLIESLTLTHPTLAPPTYRPSRAIFVIFRLIEPLVAALQAFGVHTTILGTTSLAITRLVII